ncbi:SDR family oxidoreductase [archaeon]|nr:SDR family oxidoreductase [archaeon]
MATNRTALVTGASSGIGREIAIQLAKNGIDVCINYSNSKEKAEAVVEEIKKSGGNAVSFPADVSREDDVQALFEFIRVEFKGLDILINNAGIGNLKLMEDQDYNEWKQVVEINLGGKFLCAKYATPLLKKSKSPQIINIASRLATKPMERASAYGPSASGIVMLTRVLALELSKYNIQVNSISPGLIRTPLTEKEWSVKDFSEYAKNNPSGRIGETIDVANAILFLISDKASYINGENININGGSLLK